MAENYRFVEIVERGIMKQKFYARFIADNGQILSVTEKYNNLTDLKGMLEKYYPEWPVREDM